MTLIPLVLIVTGGVMIYAGVKGDNPLVVFKSVLTGVGIPQGNPSTNVPVTPPNPGQLPNVPGTTLNRDTPGLLSGVSSVPDAVPQGYTPRVLPGQLSVR